jgi:hypothetical protein
MQEKPFQDRGNRGKGEDSAEIAEITRKLCEKFHFRIRKSSTKFHIKLKKHHFKLRKARFKRGLERNCKRKMS